MRLHSPQSAILSAVIFNAIIIVALIPLSLRGVRYTPSSASKLLSRNLYVYGLGGIIAPFIGIKLIDLVVQLFPGMSDMKSLQLRSPALGRVARAAGAHRHRRHRLPAVHLAGRAAPGPAGQGRRVDRRGRRKAGGQQPDRSVVHRRRRQPAAAVLPEPAVGGRRRLRPAGHQREQPGPESIVDTPADPSQPKDDNGYKPSLLTLVCARSAAVGAARRCGRVTAVLHRRRCRRGAVGDRSARLARQRRPPDPGGQRQRAVRNDNDAVPEHLRGRAGRVRQVRRGLLRSVRSCRSAARPRPTRGARRRRHRQRQRAGPAHLHRPTPTSRSNRVAKARGVSADQVRADCRWQPDGRVLGFFGEPGSTCCSSTSSSTRSTRLKS